MLFKSMRDANLALSQIDAEQPERAVLSSDARWPNGAESEPQCFRFIRSCGYDRSSIKCNGCDATEDKVRSEGFRYLIERPQYSGRSEEKYLEVQFASAVKQPASFDSPESFVTSMKPYAEKSGERTRCWFVIAISTSGTWNRLCLRWLRTLWATATTYSPTSKADRSWKGVIRSRLKRLSFRRKQPLKSQLLFPFLL